MRLRAWAQGVDAAFTTGFDDSEGDGVETPFGARNGRGARSRRRARSASSSADCNCGSSTKAMIALQSLRISRASWRTLARSHSSSTGDAIR